MSLAHAPKTTCPRCLELRPSEIHTCSPTDFARGLEADRLRYHDALLESLLIYEDEGQDDREALDKMAKRIREALDHKPA